MITLTLTENELRYLRFAVMADREVLGNGDFDDDDHKQEHSDSDSVLMKIDAELAKLPQRVRRR